MAEPILKVRNLSVSFTVPDGEVHAVNDVSFNIDKGECLGIIGESGCGKSVTVLSIMGLIKPPGRVTATEIRFTDQSLLEMDPRAMDGIRGSKLAMVFQNPVSALNPCFTIGRQLVDVVKRHLPNLGKAEAKERVIDRLWTVGFSDPESRFYSYPFELSGGLNQRVMIAMALLCSPQLLIADEPTTALDVSIQAQILDLIKTLQQELRFSLIFISHDLAVVEYMASNVLVMYAGSAVEYAPAATFFADPRHPYSIGLLRSCLALDIDRSKPIHGIEGEPPDLYHAPAGCPFSPRCTMAQPICLEEKPVAATIGTGHTVACHLYRQGGN